MDAIFFVNVDSEREYFTTDAPVIAVKGFERGYHPIYTCSSAEELNARQAWTADEVESALMASMFGWDTPAARPAIAAIERREKQRYSTAWTADELEKATQ